MVVVTKCFFSSVMLQHGPMSLSLVWRRLVEGGFWLCPAQRMTRLPHCESKWRTVYRKAGLLSSGGPNPRFAIMLVTLNVPPKSFWIYQAAFFCVASICCFCLYLYVPRYRIRSNCCITLRRLNNGKLVIHIVLCWVYHNWNTRGTLLDSHIQVSLDFWVLSKVYVNTAIIILKPIAENNMKYYLSGLVISVSNLAIAIVRTKSSECPFTCQLWTGAG